MAGVAATVTRTLLAVSLGRCCHQAMCTVQR
jgi:hypothetical protein